MPTIGSDSLLRSLLLGFVAGALAVATFHQLTYYFLSLAGMVSGTVYSMRPIPPWGVPAILNQMFWGGLWGVVFAPIVDRLPRGWPLVVVGLAFGLLGPLVGSWFIVPAIKGNPMMSGLVPARMLVSVLLNAFAFGIGVALIFTLLRGRLSGTGPTARA